MEHPPPQEKAEKVSNRPSWSRAVRVQEPVLSLVPGLSLVLVIIGCKVDSHCPLLNKIQAGLELAMYLRMALNSRAACL